MQLKLDRFGRMVLPKAIRDDYGLGFGDILEAEETKGAIVLRPLLRSESSVKREGSALVYTGHVGSFSGKILDDVRQSRLDKVAGMPRAS